MHIYAHKKAPGTAILSLRYWLQVDPSLSDFRNLPVNARITIVHLSFLKLLPMLVKAKRTKYKVRLAKYEHNFPHNVVLSSKARRSSSCKVKWELVLAYKERMMYV